MIGLAIAVWILVVLTFLIGYGIGRASLTPVEPEEEDE